MALNTGILLITTGISFLEETPTTIKVWLQRYEGNKITFVTNCNDIRKTAQISNSLEITMHSIPCWQENCNLYGFDYLNEKES